MKHFILIVYLMTTQHALLKASYTPANGSDPEYGQVAIERNELPHREIERNVWLIQVDSPADIDDWQRRLNIAVVAKQGSFRVTHTSAEEKRKVQSGEISLQK